MSNDRTKRDYWQETNAYFKNCFDYLRDMMEYLTPDEIKKNNLGAIQKILIEETKNPTQKDIDYNNRDAIYPYIEGEKCKLTRLQAAYEKWEKWADKNPVSFRNEVTSVMNAIHSIRKFDKAEPHPSTHSIQNLQFLAGEIYKRKLVKPVKSPAKSFSAPAAVSRVGVFGVRQESVAKSVSDPGPRHGPEPRPGKK